VAYIIGVNRNFMVTEASRRLLAAKDPRKHQQIKQVTQPVFHTTCAAQLISAINLKDGRRERQLKH